LPKGEKRKSPEIYTRGLTDMFKNIIVALPAPIGVSMPPPLLVVILEIDHSANMWEKIDNPKIFPIFPVA